MNGLLRHLKFHEDISSILTLNTTLGFLAGFIDALGYIALFGLFTAHITGNLVLFGAELAEPGHHFPLLKILVFPAFMLGVALAKIVAYKCRGSTHNALLILYLVEMMLLTAFMFAGIMAGPLDEDDVTSIIMSAGILAAIAMGVHSGCGRVLLKDLTPTGMMTGNVTQLVIEFVGLVLDGAEGRARRDVARYLWPIVAFGLGALIAAFSYARFGFHAMLLPIAMIFILVCVEKWGKV